MLTFYFATFHLRFMGVTPKICVETEIKLVFKGMPRNVEDSVGH